MKFIGFYNYTVILTYISLFSGVFGIGAAANGRVGLAVICLMFSGFCDMFDGAVARTKKDRTEDEKNFGIQLDSLCDVICFGVLPAVILYFSGVKTFLGIIILLCYVLCGLIRLAFFNVLETKRQTVEDGCAKGYRGLPITMASAILPIFYFLGLFLDPAVMVVIYHILPAVIAFFFVFDIHIPKIDISKIFKK